MPYRDDIFAPGQYYHIYNRSAGKGQVFFNQGNYEYFLRLVKRYYQKYGVMVTAYCLMPNHYHFLIRQETGEPLSKFMQVLCNAYAQAVNIEQGRSGTLFEGRFRHKCVDKWEYLVTLCRYIHRNPVKAGLVSKPEDWLYSNYQDWIGVRNGKLVDKIFIEDHFSKPDEYIAFVNDVDDEKKDYEKINKYIFD
jgi:putative transposase